MFNYKTDPEYGWYRGYRITERYKVSHHKNPISGHEWSEQHFNGTYRVYGGKALNHTFRSIKKAEEYIDFLIKVENFHEEVK